MVPRTRSHDKLDRVYNSHRCLGNRLYICRNALGKASVPRAGRGLIDWVDFDDTWTWGWGTAYANYADRQTRTGLTSQRRYGQCKNPRRAILRAQPTSSWLAEENVGNCTWEAYHCRVSSWASVLRRVPRLRRWACRRSATSLRLRFRVVRFDRRPTHGPDVWRNNVVPRRDSTWPLHWGPYDAPRGSVWTSLRLNSDR